MTPVIDYDALEEPISRQRVLQPEVRLILAVLLQAEQDAIRFGLGLPLLSIPPATRDRDMALREVELVQFDQFLDFPADAEFSLAWCCDHLESALGKRFDAGLIRAALRDRLHNGKAYKIGRRRKLVAGVRTQVTLARRPRKRRA